MLADCIRLAQTNNEALEALLQKFAPLIKKCGRQLHIEDGNEEMILAFIELVKDFSPSNLRNIDDGTVVQYIKQSMYHYCFRIYRITNKNARAEDNNKIAIVAFAKSRCLFI